jgi:hypothetical protein
MPRGVYQRKLKSIHDRLMSKTHLSGAGCWLWQGSKGPMGHGQIMAGFHHNLGRKLLMVHRVSYELFVGPIPKGMCVCHKCDVPNCIRPDHLFLGTKAENSADMVAKGRARCGSDLPQAKLTEADVLAIRASTSKQKELSQKYGVSQGAISSIRSRRLWKHL